MEENKNGWIDRVLEEALIEGKTDCFHDTYSFKEKPSKRLLNREEVIKAKAHLDFAFNQYLAYEENKTKFVFDEEFSDSLDSFTDWTLMKWFLSYMEGYVEGVEEGFDDPWLITFTPNDDE